MKTTDLHAELDVLKKSLTRVYTLIHELADTFPSDNAQILAIQHAVCFHFDLPLSSMTVKNRCSVYVYVRQVAMYLCRKHTNASQRDIAHAFGKEDHGTVAYACQQIQNRLDTDKKVVAQVAAIEAKLTEDKIIP